MTVKNVDNKGDKSPTKVDNDLELQPQQQLEVSIDLEEYKPENLIRPATVEPQLLLDPAYADYLRQDDRQITVENNNSFVEKHVSILEVEP